MPCICYGARSEEEEVNEFLKSENGKQTMEHLTNAAFLINSHRVSTECTMNKLGFQQVFATAFIHLLIGCDEKKKTNTD